MISRIGGNPISTIPLEHRKGNYSGPFSRMLSDAQQPNDSSSVKLYLRTEKTVYSGGIGQGSQTVYAEYTDDSTEEDPTVRILGQDLNGEYGFICHINDIDPENASYAEMCALFGHLQKTGQFTRGPGSMYTNVLPYGISIGNVTQRQDFMSKIDTMTGSQMFFQPGRDEAQLLLRLYQDFIRANKTADALSLADPTDDFPLKAAYDQLSAVSKDVLDRMKAGHTDITQHEWTNLCRELKDAGLISDSDFMRTRADLRMVPIGYVDGNGDYVLYDNPPVLSSGLLEGTDYISGYSGLSRVWTVSDWSGDPFRYFDEWIEALRRWRADLTFQRNDDGTSKYGDFSPLENDINSCRKVTELIKNLMNFV